MANYKLRIIDYKKSLKDMYLKVSMIHNGQLPFVFKYIPQARYTSLLMLDYYLSERKELYSDAVVNEIYSTVVDPSTGEEKILVLDQTAYMDKRQNKMKIIKNEDALRDSKKSLDVVSFVNSFKKGTKKLSLNTLDKAERKEIRESSVVVPSIFQRQFSNRNTLSFVDIISSKKDIVVSGNIVYIGESLRKSVQDLFLQNLAVANRNKELKMSLNYLNINASKERKKIVVEDIFLGGRKSKFDLALSSNTLSSRQLVKEMSNNDYLLKYASKETKNMQLVVEELAKRESLKNMDLADVLLGFKGFLAYLMDNYYLADKFNLFNSFALEDLPIIGQKAADYSAELFTDTALLSTKEKLEALLNLGIVVSNKEDRKALIEFANLSSRADSKDSIYSNEIYQTLSEFVLARESEMFDVLNKLELEADKLNSEGLIDEEKYLNILALIDNYREAQLFEEVDFKAQVDKLKTALLEDNVSLSNGIIYDYNNFDFASDQEFYFGGYGVPEYYESDNPFNTYYPWGTSEEVTTLGWSKIGTATWEINEDDNSFTCSTSSSNITGFVKDTFNRDEYRLRVRFKVEDSNDKAVGVLLKYQDELNHYRFTINGGDNADSLNMVDYMELIRVQDGLETLVASPMQSFYWDKDSYYFIECVVLKNRLKIFVNSVLQYDIVF